MTLMRKYRLTGPMVTGMAAVNPSHNGKVGTAMMNSIIRWMMVSTQPPKYPEMPPRVIPSAKASSTPMMPTVIEIRVA